MAIGTLSAVTGVNKLLGSPVSLKGIGGAIGGLFGKSEPNAGQSNFVDALDNFEKVSTSTAQRIIPNINQMIVNGATDLQIAKYIDSQSYRKGNGEHLMKSWKWDIIQKFIDNKRLQNQSFDQSNSVVQPGMNVTGGISFIPQWMYLVFAVIGFWYFKTVK